MPARGLRPRVRSISEPVKLLVAPEVRSERCGQLPGNGRRLLTDDAV